MVVIITHHKSGAEIHELILSDPWDDLFRQAKAKFGLRLGVWHGERRLTELELQSFYQQYIMTYRGGREHGRARD